VLKGHKEPIQVLKDQQDHKGLKDLLARQGHKVQLDHKELKVRQVLKVHKVLIQEPKVL
jgi:hypothetical protein